MLLHMGWATGGAGGGGWGMGRLVHTLITTKNDNQLQ